MKNKSLKEKFQNNTIVKPLYRKVGRKVKPRKLKALNIDKSIKLDGDDLEFKRQILYNSEIAYKDVNDVLPGICENDQRFSKIKVNLATDRIKLSDPVRGNRKMITRTESDLHSAVSNYKSENNVQVDGNFAFQKVPETWLRVFPAPALPQESTCSMVLRCLVSQAGLATFLTVWTLIWTFVIQAFEGPFELQVSEDFENAQNQLVIDLATELRQITPLSPKWREAIEQRIAEARTLTILAVGRGARATPGHFWDLPGTLLFNIYVMTALGFGAPVPHTVWGRSSALIYALIAVPTHIYLMVNASTCLIVNLEQFCCRRKAREETQNNLAEKIVAHNSKENQHCNRAPDLLKNSKQANFGRKLLAATCVLCGCRCVPLAALCYYACGAILFGVLRDLDPVDIFMFPLQFTTTGGLQRVEGFVRILYGLYVEGAMVLLSCALATLKRHSSTRLYSLAQTYRLFQVER